MMRPDVPTLQRVELVAVHFVREPHIFFTGLGGAFSQRHENYAICEVNVHFRNRRAERRGLVVTTARGLQARREGSM